jgi:hypothetical protein
VFSERPAIGLRERRLLRAGQVLSLCTMVPLLALGVPLPTAIVLSFVPTWFADWAAGPDRPFSAAAVTVLHFTTSMVLGLELVPRLLIPTLEPWRAWLVGGAVAALTLLAGARLLRRGGVSTALFLPGAPAWQRTLFVTGWVGFWALVGPWAVAL